MTNQKNTFFNTGLNSRKLKRELTTKLSNSIRKYPGWIVKEEMVPLSIGKNQQEIETIVLGLDLECELLLIIIETQLLAKTYLNWTCIKAFQVQTQILIWKTTLNSQVVETLRLHSLVIIINNLKTKMHHLRSPPDCNLKCCLRLAVRRCLSRVCHSRRISKTKGKSLIHLRGSLRRTTTLCPGNPWSNFSRWRGPRKHSRALRIRKTPQGLVTSQPASGVLALGPWSRCTVSRSYSLSLVVTELFL